MDPVYPTDLADEQWGVLEPLLPPAKHGGRPRTVSLRLVLNTIFYLTKTGCQWAMLPKDLAKRSTTNDYFTAWKADGTWQALLDALRRRVRVAAGHEPEPQKAAIDSQSVKGSEAGGPRGFDGGKKINGRKRHLVVDSLGLLLVVLVTSANADDGTTAPEVLKKLSAAHRSRLDEVRGDSKYHNRAQSVTSATSQATLSGHGGRTPRQESEGLVHLPYRWVIERTNAWTGKYRRNSKDYERTTSAAEAMIQASMIHLMLKRLKPEAPKAPFRYERKPMKKAA